MQITTTRQELEIAAKRVAIRRTADGVVELAGNRATVCQGGIYSAHARQTTFSPSYRFITDLGTDRAQTALTGGPSGRRFSAFYTTDIERWLHGEFKGLAAE